jgi:hypothetical protein
MYQFVYCHYFSAGSGKHFFYLSALLLIPPLMAGARRNARRCLYFIVRIVQFIDYHWATNEYINSCRDIIRGSLKQLDLNRLQTQV